MKREWEWVIWRWSCLIGPVVSRNSIVVHSPESNCLSICGFILTARRCCTSYIAIAAAWPKGPRAVSYKHPPPPHPPLALTAPSSLSSSCMYITINTSDIKPKSITQEELTDQVPESRGKCQWYLPSAGQLYFGLEDLQIENEGEVGGRGELLEQHATDSWIMIYFE